MSEYTWIPEGHKPLTKLADFNEGNFVIYSELSSGPQYSYANSLTEIYSGDDGELYPRCLAVESGGVYIEHKSKPENDLSMSQYFDETCHCSADGYSDGDDPVEYLNRVLPLPTPPQEQA